MFKRLIGLLLCAVMLLSMAMPAYATESEEPTEITVTTLQIGTVEEFLKFAENCRLPIHRMRWKMCSKRFALSPAAV